MNLDKLINDKYGLRVKDITQIYHGGNNVCRCGCAGNYFKPGDRGFTRALNRIQKADFKLLPLGKDDIDKDKVYLNLPYDADFRNGMGKCYCLYFDER